MIHLAFWFLLLLYYSSAQDLSKSASSGKIKKAAVCPPTFAMEDFLKKTGMQDKDVTKYALLFKNHNVGVAELLRMKIPEIQALGVTVYGDAAKITGTSSQDKDQCLGRNPCSHGGVCKDGYECFSCLCDPESGYYGLLCNKKCLCKNGARCVTTVTGYECVCAPGWRGVLCEEQWLNEDVAMNLQAQVTEQQKELNDVKRRLNATEDTVEKIKQKLDNTSLNKGWNLVRVDAVFPKLSKFQLHQQTPTYVEKPPVALTTNTKAIIISVYCNFWNNNGHAYLNFDVYQKGNEKTGKASVQNTHYNVYANTFYYEVMVPWDVSLGDDIIFKITSGYYTGGDKNWYQVKLVGYITV